MEFFKNICRTCGLKRNNLLNLFKKDQEEDSTLGEKLSLLTNSFSEINEGDELPQHICYCCARKLESAVIFLNRIKTNNNKLWEVVNSAGNESNSGSFVSLDNVEHYSEEHDSNDFDINHIPTEELILNDVEIEESTMEEDMLEEYSRDSVENYEIIEINSNNSSPIQTKIRLTEPDVSEKGIICNECEKVYFTEKALNLHKKFKHKIVPTTKLTFKCTMCDKHLKSESELNLHVNLIHIIEQDEVRLKSVEKSIKVDSTDNLEEENDDQLNSNSDLESIKTEILPKSYVKRRKKTSLKCHICSKFLVCEKYLNDHLRNQHKLLYECPADGCQKLFPNKYKVSAHLKRHHSIPFSNTETRLLVPTLSKNL